MPPELPHYRFARIHVRARGALTDVVVYWCSVLVLLLLIGIVPMPSERKVWLFYGWLAAATLYEPMLVWRFGATLGHLSANVRVLDVRTGRPPGLLQALGRSILKVLALPFGLASFAWMGITRRHQALHDLATRTMVTIADPARARPRDYVIERAHADQAVAAPAWRRILAILGALALVRLVLAAIATLTLSAPCHAGSCGEMERLWLRVLWFTASAGVCGCIALGWRGLLPGTRH